MADSDGRDSVVLYIEQPKSMKQLPPNRNVCADTELLQQLADVVGVQNVKVV